MSYFLQDYLLILDAFEIGNCTYIFDKSERIHMNVGSLCNEMFDMS